MRQKQYTHDMFSIKIYGIFSCLSLDVYNLLWFMIINICALLNYKFIVLCVNFGNWLPLLLLLLLHAVKKRLLNQYLYP